MYKPHAPPRLLHKHHSWSPDMHRDEAWLRRKGSYSKGCRRSKSVTDEDLEELKGCIELGFGFNLPEIDPKLSDTFPALGFYYAVNKQYSNLARSSSSSSIASVVSDSSDVETTSSIFDPDLDFMFHMFFLARYCKLLEENSFRGRTADFFYMLLFGASVLTSTVLIGG